MKIPEARILVVDPVYLVAMEAERILTDRLECRVQIAMPRECQVVLDETSFDVVVMEGLLVKGERHDLLMRHQLAGTGIVFTAFTNDIFDDLEGFVGVKLVSKPFDDEELTEAVRAALALRLDMA